MKRTRDLLIIVVLGGLVVWWIVGFYGRIQQSSVNLSPIVVKAEKPVSRMG